MLFISFCFLIIAGIIIRIAGFILKYKYNISLDSLYKSLTLPKSLITYLNLFLIGPLIEEILFRLWQDYRIKNILIISVLIFLFFVKYIAHVKHFSTLSYIIDIIIIIISLFVYYIFNEKYGNKEISISIKRKRVLFCLSAILFGFLHISNYSPINYRILFIYPFLVLPQIIAGFTIGYTRIKYGFVYGLFLHFMINLITVII